MQEDSTEVSSTTDRENMADLVASIVSIFNNVAMAIVTVLVVAGGTIPYYFQYREIQRTQNAKGFSLYVCLTLLLANILRILFWWGRHFELPLLFQSIVMIVCMLIMIEVSVRVHRKEILPPRQLRTIWGGHLVSDFWHWTDFGSYAAVTAAFAVVMTVLTRALLFWPLYIEVLGFLALFLEANLGTPQLWANYVRKSTAGMSISMVLMWLLGDVSKTVYFLVRQTPAQFWSCGLFQVAVDIVILLQVRFYRRYGSVITTGSAPLKVTKSEPLM